MQEKFSFDEFKEFFKKRSVIEYSIMVVVTVISILLLHDRLENKALLKEYSNPITITGEYSIDGGNTFIPTMILN